MTADKGPYAALAVAVRDKRAAGKREEARFLRSKKDRILLWTVAQGRCAQCGIRLPEDWEADHIVAWAKTHRTNIHEMQALCKPCNRQKGDS
jgi:5-methylcytosine-specific restriction endonuclease McrA